LVVKTPAKDYDDSYFISYAKTRTDEDTYMVTNDLFRDYVEKKKDPREKETERLWIIEKSIR